MGLRKDETATAVQEATGVAAVQEQVTHEIAPVQEQEQEQVTHEIAPVAHKSLAPTGGVLKELADAGFEGLAFDWLSFPAIALKNEGVFVDTDGCDYGKEIFCKMLQTKTRWVFRGSPVVNNKTDVAYSYDKVTTANGALLVDTIKEWEALGKTIEEKEYIELLVELVAPGSVTDGDFRILSISPTSKGRLSGYIGKVTMKHGAPDAVVSRVSVGAKVTNVQQPFYPFAFEVASKEHQAQ